MGEEWSEWERGIINATPGMEATMRDRILFQSGMAAERHKSRRRLWMVSVASSSAASAASVVASWLFVMFAAPSWNASRGDSPTRVDAPSVAQSLTEAQSPKEAVLRVRGIAISPGEESMAVVWPVETLVKSMDAVEEHVWRARWGKKEWEY